MLNIMACVKRKALSFRDKVNMINALDWLKGKRYLKFAENLG